MGKLIVFEGTDGSGKATQTELLCQALEKQGIPFRRLAFPRYGEESSGWTATPPTSRTGANTTAKAAC